MEQPVEIAVPDAVSSAGEARSGADLLAGALAGGRFDEQLGIVEEESSGAALKERYQDAKDEEKAEEFEPLRAQRTRRGNAEKTEEVFSFRFSVFSEDRGRTLIGKEEEDEKVQGRKENGREVKEERFRLIADGEEERAIWQIRRIDLGSGGFVAAFVTGMG